MREKPRSEPSASLPNRPDEALWFKTMLLEAQSETSMDGILIVDDEGHAIHFNKRFGEIWRIPQGVLDTKGDEKMLEFVLKQLKDPGEFRRKVAYLYEHKDEKSRDEIKFADGRFLDRYSSPLMSADGKYHGRIWFFHDITERKRGEELLRESEELFKSVVLNSPDLTILTDAEGVATYVSPQCERVTGYGPETFLGKRMPGIIHPDDAALCKEAWDHVLLEGGEIHEFEYRIVDGDGKSRWVSHSATLMRVGERNLGVQNSIRDITKRTQAEKEIIETLDQLQGIRESLVRIEKEATIGRMAAGVAHEILNPASIISSRLQFVEGEEGISDQTRKSLKVCREQIQRIARISREILESSVGWERPHSPGDFRRVIELSLQTARQRIEEGRVMVEYAPPPESLPVEMAEESLSRAMANLILNACDAMAGSERKKLILALRVLSAPARGPSVLAIVADSGHGIPSGAERRVFEPFFTTKDTGQGSGLGLAICKGIIEEHGGTIRAENNEMGGSSFIVELPLHQG